MERLQARIRAVKDDIDKSSNWLGPARKRLNDIDTVKRGVHDKQNYFEECKEGMAQTQLETKRVWEERESLVAFSAAAQPPCGLLHCPGRKPPF